MEIPQGNTLENSGKHKWGQAPPSRGEKSADQKSSNDLPLGEVIEKFLAAKSNRSEAYMHRLNADMRLFQAHFGADRPIDRIRSDGIEDFLDL